jgi:lysophospholipase L1-like esterase
MTSRAAVPPRRLRRASAAALTVVLAGGLAACSSEERTEAQAQARVTVPALRYVALGDSYTAAPLVPETDLSNGCLRSTQNYPALVAAASPDTELVDVSCSSADSASMVGAQRAGDQAQAPQFDALTEETDLVTVGIGGNDFNLFGTLVGVCPGLRATDPTGAPCEARFTSGGTDQLGRRVEQIGSHVAAIVEGIRDRAPDARVIVVGYPQILPDRGTCPDLLPLADGDVDYARRIVDALTTAIVRAARRSGAEYADVRAATAGHDICADDPWVNGRHTDARRALAFHPFAAEQQAVADLLLEML